MAMVQLIDLDEIPASQGRYRLRLEAIHTLTQARASDKAIRLDLDEGERATTIRYHYEAAAASLGMRIQVRGGIRRDYITARSGVRRREYATLYVRILSEAGAEDAEPMRAEPTPPASPQPRPAPPRRDQPRTRGVVWSRQ